MAGIQRPAIRADIGAKTARLDKPLRGVVATFAEAHEWAEPEFVDIAAMRLNVVADCRRLGYASFKAEHAQRVFAQLMPPDLRPAISGVPLVPLRRSAAGAHSLAIIAGRSNLSHAAPIH
jgi:hypothetical protein